MACVNCRSDVPDRATRIFPGSDRRTTQRHPGPMPAGLRSPLRQCPAGWNGVVAMPAEKYVEPLARLSKRRARRRSTGRVQDRARPCRCAEHGARDRTHQASRRNRGAGRAQGSGRHSEETEQRAGDRDPQRLSFGLPKSLRRCADWRRGGTAVSGKKQVASLGGLPKGCRCRERRRRHAHRRRRRSGCRGDGGPCRCTGRARAGASADVAARGVVRAALGMRFRCPRTLRRRSTRRRADHAVPSRAIRIALSRLPRHTVPIRCAIGRARSPTACRD
jgi:hypothetical protein